MRPKALETQIVSQHPDVSVDVSLSDKVDDELSASRSEEHDVIPLSRPSGDPAQRALSRHAVRNLNMPAVRAFKAFRKR
jgi:hypothetical protein